MGGGDDDRHAPADMIEDGAHEHFALVVGERELLGIIRQDADAVGAGIDEKIDAAPLAGEVELAVLVERRRGDGKDSLEACCCHHPAPPPWSCSMLPDTTAS